METDKRIAAGLTHSLFLSTAGSVYACGFSDKGALGCHESTVYLPQQLSIPVPVKSVAAGNHFSLCLDYNGDVWACGNCIYGESGLGNGDPVFSPTKIPDLPEIRAIAASKNFYSAFVDVDGYVWVCGINSYGELGLKAPTQVNIPTRVPNIPKMTSVSCGDHHSLMKDENGNLWGCGYNTHDQLGIPGKAESCELTKIESIPQNIIDFAAGNYHSLFLDGEGFVWSCGVNNNCELGRGYLEYNLNKEFLPGKITTLPKITRVAAGNGFSTFIDENQNVWKTSGVVPNVQLELSNITDISCVTHLLSLDKSGVVWVKGNGQDPALGMEEGFVSVLPVPNPNLPTIGKLQVKPTKSARNVC